MDSTTQIQNEAKTDGQPGGAAKLIRQVRQATKRRLSTEDKIRIVLEGFRKEIAVTDLCRRERISSAVYYAWLKQFMEAGKAQLRHDTLRGATNDGIAPPCVLSHNTYSFTTSLSIPLAHIGQAVGGSKSIIFTISLSLSGSYIILVLLPQSLHVIK